MFIPRLIASPTLFIHLVGSTLISGFPETTPFSAWTLTFSANILKAEDISILAAISGVSSFPLFSGKAFHSSFILLALPIDRLANIPICTGTFPTANAKVKPTLSNPFFRKVPILSKAYFTASTEPFCSAINERATEAPAICFLFIPKYSVYFLDISLILAKVSGF